MGSGRRLGSPTKIHVLILMMLFLIGNRSNTGYIIGTEALTRYLLVEVTGNRGYKIGVTAPALRG